MDENSTFGFGSYDNTTEKTYFNEGDTVRVRHGIGHRPIMVVKSIDKTTDETGRSVLLGVSCFWFDLNMTCRTERFNTKDLEHYVIVG